MIPWSKLYHLPIIYIILQSRVFRGWFSTKLKMYNQKWQPSVGLIRKLAVITTKHKVYQHTSDVMWSIIPTISTLAPRPPPIGFHRLESTLDSSSPWTCQMNRTARSDPHLSMQSGGSPGCYDLYISVYYFVLLYPNFCILISLYVVGQYLYM